MTDETACLSTTHRERMERMKRSEEAAIYRELLRRQHAVGGGGGK